MIITSSLFLKEDSKTKRKEKEGTCFLYDQPYDEITIDVSPTNIKTNLN